MSHRQRHILTGALGASAGRPEGGARPSRACATAIVVLVASDGLTEMVPDDRIAAILAKNGSPREATSALVDAALDAGGLDNVTVIVARCAFAAGPR